MDLLIIQCIVALQCTGKVNLLSYQVHSQNETIAHLIIRLSLLHEKSKDDPCGQGVRSNRFQWTPCLWFSLNSLAFAILATLYFMYHITYRKNNNLEKCAGMGLNGFHIK